MQENHQSTLIYSHCYPGMPWFYANIPYPEFCPHLALQLRLDKRSYKILFYGLRFAVISNTKSLVLAEEQLSTSTISIDSETLTNITRSIRIKKEWKGKEKGKQLQAIRQMFVGKKPSTA